MSEVTEKIQKEKLEKKGVTLSEEQQAKLKEAVEALKLPVEFTDKDFKMGEGELDIRQLNKKNTIQVFFRLFASLVAYIKDLNDNVIDVERLIMILLKKNGVTDVVKETEDVMNELLSNIKK